MFANTTEAVIEQQAHDLSSMEVDDGQLMLAPAGRGSGLPRPGQPPVRATSKTKRSDFRRVRHWSRTRQP